MGLKINGYTDISTNGGICYNGYMDMHKKYIDKFHQSYKIDDSGCWIWRGRMHKSGYGYIRVSNRGVKKDITAHRFSLIILEKLPEGYMALHTCDKRLCVNPEHLYAGTAADNARDSAQRTRNDAGYVSGNPKLTESEVRLIHADARSLAMIAKDYGVSIPTVNNIKTEKTWLHLKLGKSSVRSRKIEDVERDIRSTLAHLGQLRRRLGMLEGAEFELETNEVD